MHLAHRGQPVWLAHVVGVHSLEAQALQVGDDGEEPASHKWGGQQGAREQPADLGRRLALEDQAGAQAHHPRLWVFGLELVEEALDVGLIPRVERTGDPRGGPVFVHPGVLRPGRVGAHRGGVDERVQPGVGRCAKHARALPSTFATRVTARSREG